MPVILTDVAGREPMVVLPLEAYEALLEEQGAQEGQRPDVKGQRSDTPPDSESPSVQKHERQRDPDSIQRIPKVQPEPVKEPKPLASDPAPQTPSSDGLRVRQRDEDRVQALHRSLDTVSHEVPAQQLPQNEGGDGLVLEERFSFQP